MHGSAHLEKWLELRDRRQRARRLVTAREQVVWSYLTLRDTALQVAQ
jgi:hypothetical protein